MDTTYRKHSLNYYISILHENKKKVATLEGIQHELDELVDVYFHEKSSKYNGQMDTDFLDYFVTELIQIQTYSTDQSSASILIEYPKAFLNELAFGLMKLIRDHNRDRQLVKMQHVLIYLTQIFHYRPRAAYLCVYYCPSFFSEVNTLLQRTAGHFTPSLLQHLLGFIHVLVNDTPSNAEIEIFQQSSTCQMKEYNIHVQNFLSTSSYMDTPTQNDDACSKVSGTQMLIFLPSLLQIADAIVKWIMLSSNQALAEINQTLLQLLDDIYQIMMMHHKNISKQEIITVENLSVFIQLLHLRYDSMIFEQQFRRMILVLKILNAIISLESSDRAWRKKVSRGIQDAKLLEWADRFDQEKTMDNSESNEKKYPPLDFAFTFSQLSKKEKHPRFAKYINCILPYAQCTCRSSTSIHSQKCQFAFEMILQDLYQIVFDTLYQFMIHQKANCDIVMVLIDHIIQKMSKVKTTLLQVYIAQFLQKTMHHIPMDDRTWQELFQHGVVIEGLIYCCCKFNEQEEIQYHAPTKNTLDSDDSNSMDIMMMNISTTRNGAQMIQRMLYLNHLFFILFEQFQMGSESTQQQMIQRYLVQMKKYVRKKLWFALGQCVLFFHFLLSTVRSRSVLISPALAQIQYHDLLEMIVLQYHQKQEENHIHQQYIFHWTRLGLLHLLKKFLMNSPRPLLWDVLFQKRRSGNSDDVLIRPKYEHDRRQLFNVLYQLLYDEAIASVAISILFIIKEHCLPLICPSPSSEDQHENQQLFIKKYLYQRVVSQLSEMISIQRIDAVEEILNGWHMMLLHNVEHLMLLQNIYQEGLAYAHLFNLFHHLPITQEEQFDQNSNHAKTCADISILICQILMLLMKQNNSAKDAFGTFISSVEGVSKRTFKGGFKFAYGSLVKAILPSIQFRPTWKLMKVLINWLCESNVDDNSYVICDHPPLQFILAEMVPVIFSFFPFLIECDQLHLLDIFSHCLSPHISSNYGTDIINRSLCIQAHLIDQVFDQLLSKISSSPYSKTEPSPIQQKLTQLFIHLANHKMPLQLLKHILRLMQQSHKADSSNQVCLLTVLLNTFQKIILHENCHTNGPDRYFLFNGIHSGLRLPSLQYWPGSSGYSFCSWIRLEDQSPQVTQQFQCLYSFITLQKNGFRFGFNEMNQMVYEQFQTNSQRRREMTKTIISVENPLEIKKWHFLGITHGRRLSLGNQQDVLSIYLNGQVYNQLNINLPTFLACKKVNPKDTILEECHIGASALDDEGIEWNRNSNRSMNLKGQIGAIYFFKHVFSESQMLECHALGPEYIFTSEGRGRSNYNMYYQKKKPDVLLLQQQKSMIDWSSSIFLCYHPSSTQNKWVLEISSEKNTREDPDQHLLHATCLPGTYIIHTRRMSQVMEGIGGLSLFLPMYAQLDESMKYMEGSGELNLTFIHFFRTSISNNALMQRSFQDHHGFQVISYLSSRLSPFHQSLKFAQLIQQWVVEALSASQGHSFSSYTTRELILAFVLKLNLWIYAPAKVQLRLLQWVQVMATTNQVDNHPEIKSALSSFQFHLDHLQFTYWLEFPAHIQDELRYVLVTDWKWKNTKSSDDLNIDGKWPRPTSSEIVQLRECILEWLPSFFEYQNGPTSADILCFIKAIVMAKDDLKHKCQLLQAFYDLLQNEKYQNQIILYLDEYIRWKSDCRIGISDVLLEIILLETKTGIQKKNSALTSEVQAIGFQVLCLILKSSFPTDDIYESGNHGCKQGEELGDEVNFLCEREAPEQQSVNGRINSNNTSSNNSSSIYTNQTSRGKHFNRSCSSARNINSREVYHDYFVDVRHSRPHCFTGFFEFDDVKEWKMMYILEALPVFVSSPAAVTFVLPSLLKRHSSTHYQLDLIMPFLYHVIIFHHESSNMKPFIIKALDQFIIHCHQSCYSQSHPWISAAISCWSWTFFHLAMEISNTDEKILDRILSIVSYFHCILLHETSWRHVHQTLSLMSYHRYCEIPKSNQKKMKTMQHFHRKFLCLLLRQLIEQMIDDPHKWRNGSTEESSSTNDKLWTNCWNFILFAYYDFDTFKSSLDNTNELCQLMLSFLQQTKMKHSTYLKRSEDSFWLHRNLPNGGMQRITLHLLFDQLRQQPPRAAVDEQDQNRKSTEEIRLILQEIKEIIRDTRFRSYAQNHQHFLAWVLVTMIDSVRRYFCCYDNDQRDRSSFDAASIKTTASNQEEMLHLVQFIANQACTTIQLHWLSSLISSSSSISNSQALQYDDELLCLLQQILRIKHLSWLDWQDLVQLKIKPKTESQNRIWHLEIIQARREQAQLMIYTQVLKELLFQHKSRQYMTNPDTLSARQQWITSIQNEERERIAQLIKHKAQQQSEISSYWYNLLEKLVHERGIWRFQKTSEFHSNGDTELGANVYDDSNTDADAKENIINISSVINKTRQNHYYWTLDSTESRCGQRVKLERKYWYYWARKSDQRYSASYNALFLINRNQEQRMFLPRPKNMELHHQYQQSLTVELMQVQALAAFRSTGNISLEERGDGNKSGSEDYYNDLCDHLNEDFKTEDPSTAHNKNPMRKVQSLQFQCERIHPLSVEKGQIKFIRKDKMMYFSRVKVFRQEHERMSELHSHSPNRRDYTTNSHNHSNGLKEDQEEMSEAHSWNLNHLVDVSYRAYQFQARALEFFFQNGATLFFHFINTNECIQAYQFAHLFLHANRTKNEPKQRWSTFQTPAERFEQEENRQVTERWRRRDMSNFDYLMHLNSIAGRTYNDLSQYPVFPWILRDFTSPELDLTKAATFRDLTRPIGVQEDQMLTNFQERYASLAQDYQHHPYEAVDNMNLPPFHHGTHYSSPGFVINYLIRIEPFTYLHQQLQSGKFDHADRLFHSIAETYKSCAGSSNSSDVRELIPEFFYFPEFLLNSNHTAFGTKQVSRSVTVCENGISYTFLNLCRFRMERK